MDLIKTARGLSQLAGRVEVHTVEVETDEEGAGGAKVPYDSPFKGDPFPLVQGSAAGDYYPSSVGGKQATVRVEDGPPDTSVKVYVLVAGE